MRRIKGLAAALALSIVLTGCNWTGMPGGAFTNLSDADVLWLKAEYGYSGSGSLNGEQAHAWELKNDLNPHLYEKYYLEDDYQFLDVAELFNKEGILIWEGGRYVFCYKDVAEYREMWSADGHKFVTEDGEEFWTEESPDSERYENWEYRIERIHGLDYNRDFLLEAPEDVDPGFGLEAPEDVDPKMDVEYEWDVFNN